MPPRSQQRLNRFVATGQQRLLQGSLTGLEKETLRVSPSGCIAQSDHPASLGSALTHPWITTDYAEALLEFITPPFSDPRRSLDFLDDIHRFVYPRLGGEYLWAASMPCVLDGENSIRIAEYGRSNAGRMKHIYRLGLGHRYGKLMQVIAGVHFNFSLPTAFWPVFKDQEANPLSLQNFTSESYFCLIRNLQRLGWLIPYLFGSSPAICKSFLAGQPQRLAEFDTNTYFEPFATSLRLSDIGYTNRSSKKAGLDISYSSLDDYLTSLIQAIETPSDRFQAIGVKVGGAYRQLNANVLQIENEYYSTMRPKQLPEGFEKPSLALARRGVRYVELRSLDVNPFDSCGVNEDQLRFLEAFLLLCLLDDSPEISHEERRIIDDNQQTSALRGREPGLTLNRNGRPTPLRNWAAEICDCLEGICGVLDEGRENQPYRRALALQKEAIADPERTPSARILAEMRREGEGFFHFAQRHSQHHRDRCLARPLETSREREFQAEAERSLARQRAMETGDTVSFDAFLEHYFAQR